MTETDSASEEMKSRFDIITTVMALVDSIIIGYDPEPVSGYSDPVPSWRG